MTLAVLLSSLLAFCGTAEASQSIAPQQCKVALRGGAARETSAAEQTRILDLAQKVWQPEVIDALKPCEVGCLAWPKSMQFSFSMKDRNFVVNAAYRLRSSIHRAIPTIAKTAGLSIDSSSRSLEHLLDDAARIIIDEHSTSPAGKKEVDRGISQLQSYWQKIRGNLSFEGFQTAPLISSANSYLKRIAELREQYGEELISDEVLIGAGFGNLASRVILDTTSKSRETTRALDAISLLHPLTDNALDRGLDVKAAMQKITDNIKGLPRDRGTETKFESLTLDLLDDIFIEFPRDKHPMVVRLLMELHRAQMDSAKVQRNIKSTPDQILEIITRKGGYTGLIMAYLSQGSLTEGEAKLFYKAGSLFQMGDDLLDVREDLRDGTITAWTVGMRSRADFRRTFQMFLKLQEHLETEVQASVEDPVMMKNLRNDVEAGFKFYLISAYLNPTVSPRIGEYLNDKIPLSPRNLRDVLFTSYQNLISIENVDDRMMAAMTLYGRVFDHHFLGGQYAQWAAKNGPKARPYKISHWNPIFLAVKFESMLANGIKAANKDRMMSLIIGLGITHLAAVNYLLYFAHDSNAKLHGTAMFVTGLGIIGSKLESEKLRPWAWAWLGSFVATVGTVAGHLLP